MASRPETEFEPTGSRPASLWPESSRFADSREFTSTGFPLPSAAPLASRAAGPGSAFDMCHGGVVLRAVLFVHLVLAIGLMFGAKDFDAWLIQLALATGVALPGLLFWLVLACQLKARLAALPVAAQWFAAVALGAACAAASWALQASLGLGTLAQEQGFTPSRWLAPTLAGAAFSAALFYWLRLRAIAQGPADSSARLAELQSRIRPHFLFNTLNTAIALVRAEPAKAERVLEDLSDLFRHALAEQGDSATVGQEIELAQRYLEIEQLRFGERLRVEWALDERVHGARLPPLILQPLVENAVKHGVEPSPGGAELRISTQRRGQRALIKVTNTVPAGQGRAGFGIAQANVRDRLRLLHDLEGDFRTALVDGVYQARIEVPLPGRGA